MGDGDGRLELDELGGVIESAQRIDDAAAPNRDDVLSGGDDTPTWGERVRSSGAFFWAERHRGWLVAGAVVAVAAVAVPTAMARNRLPDLPTSTGLQISALANGIDGSLGPTVSGDSTANAFYRLDSTDPGWTATTVVGVAGPGIRESSAREIPVGDGVPRKFVVTAAFGCDLRYGESLTQTYSVTVEATDEYGRVVRESLPVPTVDYGGWYDVLGQTCWQRVPQQLAIDQVRVQSDRSTGRIVVSARVANSGSTALNLSTGWSDSLWLTADNGQLSPIPARGTAEASVGFRVSDCAAPPSDVQAQQIDGGSATMVPGVLAYATSPDQRFGTEVVVPFDGATMRAMLDARREICRGLPRLAVSDVTTGEARPADDGSGGTSIPVSLTLRSTPWAQLRATVAEAGLFVDGGMPNAAFVRDDGRVRMMWQVDCSYAPQPPVLWVESLSGPPMPQKHRLPLAPLRKALVTACPGLPANDLGINGWSGGGA
jgi:hypothetical protein